MTDIVRSASSVDDIIVEARAFIDRHWRADIDPNAWRELVVDHGFAALRWPTRWFGRDLSDADAKKVEAVFAERGVRGPVRTRPTCGRAP